MAIFTTTDKCKLFYEEHGSGEPLILVHGWSCSSVVFKDLIETFSKSYHVINYDLRGHGKSDRGEITERNMNLTRFAEDLHELIEYLKLDSVNIVGWSMGTSTLLAYVRSFGCQYVKKFCFIDMTPKLLCDDEWKLGQSCNFYQEDNLGFLALIAKDWNEAVEAFCPNCFAKNFDLSSPLYVATKKMIADNTPHCMAYMWIAMASEDFRPQLEQIRVPVLLAYSGDGLLYFQVHGEYMRDHIKNSKLVLYPGCGHGLFLEDPKKFTASLDAFLQE
jgi:pimeloyl-ACP methyl ester carboxylesterase